MIWRFFEAIPTRGTRNLVPALVLLSLLVTLVLAPTSARADLQLLLQDSSAMPGPGTTGFIDLLIRNPEDPLTGASYELSSFTVRLVVDGVSGVTLTEAFTGFGTADPYAYIFKEPFTDSTGTDLAVPPTSPFPTTDLTVSDSEFPFDPITGPLFRTILPDEVYRLARIGYTAPAGSVLEVGWLRISVLDTSLADGPGLNLVPFTVDPDIQYGAVVPEPSTLLGALLAGLTYAVAVHARHRIARFRLVERG